MPEDVAGVQAADFLRCDDEAPELTTGPLANGNAGNARALCLAEGWRWRREKEE